MPSRKLNIADMPAGLADWLREIPAAPGGVGWQAAAASLLESAAFKPGNVHPAAGFEDLHHADFVAAAQAIAEPFDAFQWRPSDGRSERPAARLGQVVLAAVTAAGRVTRSNTNLGIVLAMAPLAAADIPLEHTVQQTLASLDRNDAADIWRAISVAQPGGLGRVGRHDLAGPAPTSILEAMRLARHRDAIAQLWADSYQSLFRRDPQRPGMAWLLETALTADLPAAAAIQQAFLQHLAVHHDSLIARRHGTAVAADVSHQAAAVVRLPIDEQPAAIRRFDTQLRAGRWCDGRQRPINPGTTADLVAAAVFVLLRRGWSLAGSAGTIDGLPPVPA